MNKEHLKKMIAPIVITLLLIAYFVFYVHLLWYMPEALTPVKIVVAAVVFALICAMIYILIQRIKEIKKGENDDLSKY